MCCFWFSDSVRPMTLTSYFSTARMIVEPHPQPMSSSVIPGCRPSLPSDEVDLGHLRFFERHVVALEVGAAVRLGRVLPQPEEVVRDVVVELDFVRVRSDDLRRGLGQPLGLSFWSCSDLRSA